MGMRTKYIIRGVVLHAFVCVRRYRHKKVKEKNFFHSYIFLAVVIISTYGDLCHYFIHMVSNLLYHIPMYTHTHIHNIPCLCPYRKKFLFLFQPLKIHKSIFMCITRNIKNYYKQSSCIQHNYLWTMNNEMEIKI